MRGKKLPGGKADVKSSAVVDIDLDEGTASIKGLNLTGLGTEVNGNIDATDIECLDIYTPKGFDQDDVSSFGSHGDAYSVGELTDS